MPDQQAIDREIALSNAIWGGMTHVKLAADMPPATGLVEVAHAPHPIDGEHYDCSSPKVQCGTATVTIPANSKIGSIERHCRESAGGPWGGPNDIGWCEWVGTTFTTLPNGQMHIAATLKNWSHNRNRLARIIVHYAN